MITIIVLKVKYLEMNRSGGNDDQTILAETNNYIMITSNNPENCVYLHVIM